MSVRKPAFEGHDFSRAIKRPLGISVLAAEGMRNPEFIVPQGLKPISHFRLLAARLKSCPFKAYAGSVKAYAGSVKACAGSRALLQFVILLAAVTLCSAQQRSPSAKDPNAHDLAQRVDRHYNQLHCLKAGFTETYEGLGVRRSESGTLLLLKPGRMKWDYSSPAGKLFLLDGKFAWFYARGDSQVQRIPAKELDDLRSPLRFLLGHTELEKEVNSLTLASLPNGQFTLTGQPKGQEKRLNRLTLTVTGEGTITGIEVEEADGALTRFTFTAEKTNVPIPAEEFRFTPPPGVPVVDAMPPG
jgi:outer membrane lipoprotein carrier protein